MKTCYEYVTDKYGQGGGGLNWYESVDEFKTLMREAGMPVELEFCRLRNGTAAWRDSEGEVVLVEHDTEEVDS